MQNWEHNPKRLKQDNTYLISTEKTEHETEKTEPVHNNEKEKTETVHNNETESATNESESDDEPVVELSCNQRKPAPGEPVCIVCGRYGAYICDTYNVDVCSKECKEINRYQRSKNSGIQKVLLSSVARREVDNVPVFTRSSAEQRAALPQEEKCLVCKRIGVKEMMECGKVCSEECSGQFLTPDNIIASPPFKVHSSLRSFTATQISEIRQAMDIRMVGDGPPIILDYTHASFAQKLLHNASTLGFLLPTAIQSQVIPTVLDGSDVIACSSTGSGKTAAYLLPLIHRVSVWCSHVTDHVLSLILAPTRDVALQIESVTKSLCEGIPNMRTAVVVGGLSVTRQNYRLDSGVQIVIATPGRLLELKPDLSHCYMVVLDEFDVLLDSSFHEQVKSIICLLPPRHQTIMCSATVSDDARYHAAQLLYHPVSVTVGRPGTPADKVKQIVLWVEKDSKKKKLMSILQDKRYNKPPVLIFVQSKIGALLLADYLLTKDVMCGVIHGDKKQEDRMKIISELENRRYPVLVSTNILGRGLNMPSVTQVVMFDMPSTVDQYIHQAGRAYSRTSAGTAISFINNGDKEVFLDFEKMCVQTGVTMPVQLTNSAHLAYQKQDILIQNAKLKQIRK